MSVVGCRVRKEAAESEKVYQGGKQRTLRPTKMGTCYLGGGSVLLQSLGQTLCMAGTLGNTEPGVSTPRLRS